MLTKQHHVILRSRIDVTIDNHNQHKVVQYTLHKAIKKRLLPMLSKLFSEYAPNDAVIYLDKLIIDGGNVSLSMLSKELPRQIEESLTVNLKEAINKVIRNPTVDQVVPLLDAKRDAIAHYLSEGNFAWWMVERSEKQIEKIYLTLLDEHPFLVEQLWANFPKKEKAVQRSTALFAQTTLEHTLSYLLKQPIENFTPLLAEIGWILNQTGVLNSHLYPLGKQLLGMALLGVIKQQRAKIDQIGFLYMLLKEVAIKTSISYETILQKLDTYYTDNQQKYLFNQMTKKLVLHLRELIATPPKFGCKDVKNQEKVLKKLDQIGNSQMISYQLSAAIGDIIKEIDKPGIRPLVKSWLKEKRNKEKLVNNLSDNRLLSFFKYVDHRIKTNIGSSKTFCPDNIKTTIEQDGIIEQKFNGQDPNTTIIQPLHLIEIKRSLAGRIPFSKQFLAKLEPIISELLHVSHPQVNIDSIKNIFITAAMVDGPTTEAEYIARVAAQLKPYTPLVANLLTDGLTGSTTEWLELSQRQPYTSLVDKADASVVKASLSDVVNFLLYNECPPDKQVPAYLIAKNLGHATPIQIRDALAPFCQERAILKKLIQHATAVILDKLLEAFIPLFSKILVKLEKVILESNLLQHSASFSNTRSIKEIFITAAILHRPPTTEKQYIARLLLHLGEVVSSNPISLCDQLLDTANQVNDDHLVEAFTLLKKELTPLKLDKIDSVDLIFLSTHQKLPLDPFLIPLYYNKLLPAIKAIVRQSDATDLSHPAMHQLVTCHLPGIAKSLKKRISLMLYKEITTSIESKKERVAKRWELFLHTGKLGNYVDSTALLNDVINQLPTFPLAQDKIHVRQRLIANFTHSQLILLVKKHSDVGQTLANAIEGIYQLWCATQGALGQYNGSKDLFWHNLFKTLPKRSMAKDNWLIEVTTALGNDLEIPPTTLVQTFQLLIEDSKDIPAAEQLMGLLNKLAATYQENIEQQIIQSRSKEPLLTKLDLLLSGSLFLFNQKFHLSTHKLGNQLVQFIVNQPLALVKFLEEQPNCGLVARRMVHYFNPEVTTKIIKCLAKDHAPFVNYYLGLLSHPLENSTTQLRNLSTWQNELYIAIIDYFIRESQFKERAFIHNTLLAICYPRQDMCKIIASIVDTKIITPTKEQRKIITLLKSFINEINKPTIARFPLVNNPLEGLATNPEKESPRASRIPEETIRVYTKNTGLIFLWPFFYKFFTSHNLMVANQFISEQAAHNGVYLLQYLVTGKLKSPEWQLTLPKLLCGLAYDEVLLPYKAIDEAYDPAYPDEVGNLEKSIETMDDKSSEEPQKEAIQKIGEEGANTRNGIQIIESNSQLLFDKVIKRWIRLKDVEKTSLYQEATTQTILKNYFLNRLGILTRHDYNDATEAKFWHLAIMHQVYDKLDLLPPWSMNKLKLPWMQEEIVLFWVG